MDMHVGDWLIYCSRHRRIQSAAMGTSSLEDIKSRGFWRAVGAEFMGTAFLVLVACGSCLSDTDPDLNSKVTRISLTFGLSVGTIVWAICNVSGGHINPAVSFGFLVTRKISIVRFFFYVVFQMVGAIVGAAILLAVTPSAYTGTLCTSDTSVNASVGQVFGIELIITFIFVLTVLATCDSQREDQRGSGPLAIGLAITMCHLWAVPYSGAGMNPARVFGPAVVSNHWDNHWVYWVAPLVGGGVGALLYDFLFAVNASPVKCKGCFTRRYDDADYGASGRIKSVQVMPINEKLQEATGIPNVQ